MIRTPQLSVIIPIYNAGSYLHEAVLSIQNQTFTDFECLLCDASTDGSSNYLADFIKTDPRFILFRQPGCSLPESLQTGLEQAKAPFIARMVETSLSEVDAGVIEAAQSMGASTFQIVRKVYLPEAMPSLVLGGAISIVSILAYTAIAGTVGAGGLGDIAIRYGHQRGITSVMWVTVVFLIIFVQIIQVVFNNFAKRIDKRLNQTHKSFAPHEMLFRFTHIK